MTKLVDNRMVMAGLLVAFNLFMFTYFSFSSEAELFAQQRGTISIDQATALPLVNAAGNQVKLVVNYSIGDESILGQRINAIMGIYDRQTGSLIKLTSFPNGFIINNTEGTIQMASTLTDPKIQNVSAIVTLTNAEKFEKYSNDVRADLDMKAILPTSIPALNETSVPPPSAPSLPAPPPPSPLPPASAGSSEDTASDEDESNSEEE
jgi:hypothetical protein